MRRRSKNEYYENIKYTLYALLFTSVFPFVLQKDGGKLFQITSKILSFVSVLIYCICFNSSINFIHHFFIIDIDNVKFNSLVSQLTHAFYRISFILMPIITWTKSQPLKNHIEHWRLFQIDFQIVSAQFLINKSTRRKIRTAFLVCISCPIITYFVLEVLIYNIDFSTILFMTIGTSAYIFVLVYWYTNGMIVVSTMETLLTELQHSLQIGDHRKFKKFVHLWTKLKNLNDEFQQYFSILFLSHLGLTMLNGISSALLILNVLSGQVELDGVISFFLFINTTTIIIQVFTDVAEKIRTKMTSEVQRILLGKNIIYSDPLIIRETWYFLDIIQTNSSKINLNGYFSLARSDYLSIVIAMLNYAIVIRQLFE